MTKLQPTDPISKLEVAYQEKWGAAAPTMFFNLEKDNSCGGKTVGEIAERTAASLMHVKGVGRKACARILLVLEENEIENEIRKSLSPKVAATMIRDATKSGIER